MQALAHRPAAVVIPRTWPPLEMIVPTPKKPIPLTTCAPIRPVLHKQILTEHHSDGAADADQNVGAHSRGVIPPLPLEPDHTRKNHAKYQPYHNRKNFQPIPFIQKIAQTAVSFLVDP